MCCFKSGGGTEIVWEREEKLKNPKYHIGLGPQVSEKKKKKEKASGLRAHPAPNCLSPWIRRGGLGVLKNLRGSNLSTQLAIFGEFCESV